MSDADRHDLPKFHINPSIKHLPNYAPNKERNTVFFDPLTVAQQFITGVIKKRGGLLEFIAIVQIRFEWPSGLRPVLKVTGTFKDELRIDGKIEESVWFESGDLNKVVTAFAENFGKSSQGIVRAAIETQTRQAGAITEVLGLMA